MARLFTDDFLRTIALWRIIARQVPAGGRHADHRSRDLGSGMEFRDFRPYTPGDDLRRVDWNLYRRSGRLFLRLFETPEDLPVYILLDVSNSMFFETPPRADAAKQAAAALAAIALNQHDRTGIYPFGAELAVPLPPTSDSSGLRRVCEYIERQGPAGATDLPRCLSRFGAMGLRGGLVVVITDFFDPRGVDAVIAALGSLRHRLLLVQMVRAEDAAPALAGELTLVDCESGAAVDVTVTGSAIERYRRAYAAFGEKLTAFATRRATGHVRLDCDRPVLAQLGGVFRNGVLAV